MIAALSSAAVAVAAVLLNSLWQDAVIVLLVVVLLRVLPNANASTRYAIWWTALAASLVVPVVTTLPFLYANTASQTVSSPASTMTSTQAKTTQQTAVSKTQSAPVTQGPAATTSTAATGSLTPVHIARVRLTVPVLLAAIFAVAWLAVACAILFRLGRALLQLEKLKNDALPLPVDFRDDMASWHAATKGGRDVRLCISHETEVPVAVGLFDAMILIPQHLLDSLAHNELDQISLHELAHLRRADDWTNGLQRVIAAMLFFNPAVRYIGQQLDIEREVACDDWVVNHTGSVRPYAMCLTKMAETTSWPHRAVPAPGVFVTRKNISIRIERLLRAGRDIGTGISPAPATLAAIVLLAAGCIAWSVTPSFAFEAVPAPVPVVAIASPVPPAMPKTALSVHVPPTHVNSPKVTVALPKVTVELPKVPVSLPKISTVAVSPQASVNVVQLQQAVASGVVAKVHQALGSSVVIAEDHNNQAPPAGTGCTGCNFGHVDYSGKDLHGARFVGSNFDEANFSGANLSGANLTGSHFGRANFRNANLRNANLEGSSMDEADLTGADLTGAKLTGTHFDHVNFSGEMARVIIPQCTGCNFQGLDLHGVDLSGVHLSGIAFHNVDLSGANFSKAVLEGVEFIHCNLDGIKVNGARITGVEFPQTSTKNIDWSGATLMGIDLSGDQK